MLKNITEHLAIEAESYSNSRSWGHKAKAFYNGELVAENKIRYYNRTWERYQFESVLQGLLSKLDKDQIVPLADRYAFALFIKGDERVREDMKVFDRTASIAKLGDILCAGDQKASNDWKTRMLKTGLGGLGLRMPDDWESLPEEEKQERLNKVINEIKQ